MRRSSPPFTFTRVEAALAGHFWQGRGGPYVIPPTGKGFCSAVLEQVMAEYFENPPRIEFAADGVGYEVIGSLEVITNQVGPAT